MSDDETTIYDRLAILEDELNVEPGKNPTLEERVQAIEERLDLLERVGDAENRLEELLRTT